MPPDTTTTPVPPASPHVEATAYEYMVRLTHPNGELQDVPAGSDRALADSLAATPLAWTPPGRPGEVWVRPIRITSGSWRRAAGER
jgi:hypothetical protein